MKFIKYFILLILLQGCSSNYEWGWYILSPENIEGLTNLKFLISGITTTIYISVVSIILAMIIGLIVALPSLSNNKFLSYFNIGYVEIVRAIPLLVLILWIYYGLPIMMGISFSPFVSGIIALTISESAFQAEIFRAGINSISKGQHEVSESLGMDFWKNEICDFASSCQSCITRNGKSVCLCSKNVFFSFNNRNWRLNKKSK